MYATVRRYEGVTDPSEAGRRVNEGLCRLSANCQGSSLTTGWTPGVAHDFNERLSRSIRR